VTFKTTVIVGAGQSGLAMSRELSRLGIEHLILERGTVANAWRKDRWDSLKLLTPNWANGLPGSPYRGGDPHGYMPISTLISQLDGYVKRIGAPVQTDTDVSKVRRSESGYVIETNQGPIRCASVVLASGACAVPKRPTVQSAVPTDLFQLTPSNYKRPADLPRGGVLVVGASASGVQLAREIHLSGRPVTLAVGGHTRLPRTYRGRDIEWWLDAIGVLDDRYDSVDDLERARRTPSPQLIGGSNAVDLNALQDLGVEIVGRMTDIRNGRALFSGGLANACNSADLKMYRLLGTIDEWVHKHGLENGLEGAYRPLPTQVPLSPMLDRCLIDGGINTILWATGYRPDFSWLDVPVFDARGRLHHQGGVVDTPGLYAMGLTFMRRRRSHQISGVGDDARELAEHLVGYLYRRHAA